jgi:flagellar basal body-associated protein FliL
MADTKSIWITVLALVVVIMALVMIYAFVIQPAISGYTVQKQNEGAVQGANYVLSQIVNTVGQCQTFALPVGNQTIHLVALECLQQAQQQNAAAQTAPTTGTTAAS